MTPSGGDRSELETELDALYRAPLGEFVSRRDALAKRLRAAGAAEDSARVKALHKPTAVAWAVNRLHLERGGLAELEAASEALRRALSDLRSADQRRSAIEARRGALERATSAVVALLDDAGSAVSPALLRRIERTLLAVAIGGGAGGPDTPRAGRLDRELEPPGFEAILEVPPSDTTKRIRAESSGPTAAPAPARRAATTPRAAAAPSRAVVPAPAPAPATGRSLGSRDPRREAALRDAQKAVDDADAELERATFKVEEARGRVGDAEKALQAARKDVDAARRELAAARSRRDELRRALDRARNAP